jgi:threonine/homoserine/homoserine lactone efflux protein
MFFTNWLTLLSICLLASMVPGLSFALVLRNSVNTNRMAGIWTALGLALGMAVHATFLIIGLSTLLMSHAVFYKALQLSGAIYLAYIGYQSLFLAKAQRKTDIDMGIPLQQYSRTKALLTGIFTNLLNPKVIIFFLALFSQFLTPAMPTSMRWLYGLSAVMVEFLWFSLVAILFTHARWRYGFKTYAFWLERLSGLILLLLSLNIATQAIQAT